MFLVSSKRQDPHADFTSCDFVELYPCCHLSWLSSCTSGMASAQDEDQEQKYAFENDPAYVIEDAATDEGTQLTNV